MFIGAMAVLLGWVLRRGEDGIERGRAIIAFVGMIITGALFFSHARRRWLRDLRGRAIELAGQFVEQSQRYDILVSNAITFIQEVELVSRGYRLYVPLLRDLCWGVHSV